MPTSKSEIFTPPYPRPHKTKLSALWRFIYGWNSWIHTLFENSYSMQMGHTRMPNLDIYTVNDTDVVRTIMETRADDFPKHRLQHEILCPLLGENIFTANGEAWRRRRSMVDPAFTHTRLAKSLPVMQAAVDALLARIQADDLKRPLSIDLLMTHVTADIIYRTILSERLDEDAAKHIFEKFSEFQNATQKITTCRMYGLPSFWLTRRQKAAADAIRGRLVTLISAREKSHREAGERKDDILNSLFEARAPDTGAPFTLVEIINEVTVLFLAGHETSASALSWSLYLLARCPHLQETLRQEIAHMRPGLVPLSHEDLKLLAGTRNLFKEALRLYPPVSFLPREATRQECLRDKLVPKGAMVTVAPWLLHRHLKIWKAPNVFDPDRFDDPNQASSIKDAYLPFGRGPRVCVGQGFATQESTLVLAEIIRRYRLTVFSEPKPVSRITLRSKEPIELIFTSISE